MSKKKKINTQKISKKDEQKKPKRGANKETKRKT